MKKTLLSTLCLSLAILWTGDSPGADRRSWDEMKRFFGELFAKGGER